MVLQLQIDNLGITSLIEGKVNPSIMIIVQMMGADFHNYERIRGDLKDK